MSRIQPIADPNYVNNQYRDASNLNARIRLHQEFSINKYGWQRWFFDQVQFVPNSRVLELGCGAGNLWLDNLDRIPNGLEIVVSDFSAGMVKQVQRNLALSPIPFQFKVIDAQSIPFDDNSFDIVIANHMLYHVPDRYQALREIARVLKPTGFFYASTNGNDHLRELNELISTFDTRLAEWGKLPVDSFNLENGAAQLRGFFGNVSLRRYPDALLVTDANLLTDYILSGRLVLPAEQRLDLAQFVAQALKANKGQFTITKDAGVFEASSIL